MKRLNDLVAVIGFSIGALLAFRFPAFIPNEDLHSAFVYLLMGGAFFYFTWSYRLPSLAYFRLPEFSLPSFAGIAVATFIVYFRITSDSMITFSFWPTITGIIHIFAIGFGEELVSRGFVFGVLRKYGPTFAVIFSSLLFGLMHLNIYFGADWDPYSAYWHCLSAASFGLIAAVLMIVCRSIVIPIAMHALYDWGVAFRKPEKFEEDVERYNFDPLLQTLSDSFFFIMFDLIAVAFLLAIYWIRYIRRLPRFLARPAIKYGLVELHPSSSPTSRKHLNPIGRRIRRGVADVLRRNNLRR